MKTITFCFFITLHFCFFTKAEAQSQHLYHSGIHLVENFDLDDPSPNLQIESYNGVLIHNQNSEYPFASRTENTKLDFQNLLLGDEFSSLYLSRSNQIYDIKNSRLREHTDNQNARNIGSVPNQFGAKIIGENDSSIFTTSLDLMGTSLRKIDQNGVTLKKVRLGGDQFCSARSLINQGYQGNDNSLVLAGSTIGVNNSSKTISVHKFDHDLNKIWTKDIVSKGYEAVLSINQTKDLGSIILIKSSNSECSGSQGRLIKLDQNGNIVWSNCIPGFTVKLKSVLNTNIEVVETEMGFMVPLEINDSSIGEHFAIYDNDGNSVKEIYLPLNSITDIAIHDEEILLINGASLFSLNLGLYEKNIIDTKSVDKDLVIYPNPANEFINIYSNDFNMVFLYNNSGIKIAEIALDHSESRYDIYNLVDGLYFITDLEKLTVRKFIKTTNN